MLGIVEKLLREFENGVFPTKAMGKSFMDKYLKKVKIKIYFLLRCYPQVNIIRKSYQGQQSLEV